MRERSLQLTLLATVVVLALAAAPASATHVACNSTINQDTTLDSDMLCTGDWAIEIEGTGVTLDLNGHTIDGGGSGGSGVRSARERQLEPRQLEVKNGTIRGFRAGIFTESVRGQRLSNLVLRGNVEGAELFQNSGPSQVVNTRVFDNTYGLGLDGQISVSHSRVSDNTAVGIGLDFTGATLADNLIARNGVGVDLEEANADIVRNRIVGNTSAGIRYEMWQTGTVTENLIASNGVGIDLSNNIFNRIEVRNNTVLRNKGAGIKGGNSASTIERNRVERNDGTGIVSGCTPTRRNAVYGNSENGISSDCHDDEVDPSITDNDVRGNAKDGILVRNNSQLVDVTGNGVRGNGDDGIDVDGLAIEVGDDAAWSPDGAHVAATAGYRGQTAAAIYLFQSDGDSARRLVEGSEPSWSPGGTEIAYTGADGVHVIDADGTGNRFLAAGSSPQWSPAGDKILFSKEGSIYVIGVAGGTPVRLATGTDPEWAPDGNSVVYQHIREIRVVRADAADDDFVVEGGYPTWSPDGQRIAFTDGDELATIRLDGSDPRYLTTDDPQEFSPDWSPDGSRIVFLRATGWQVTAEVVAAAGGSMTKIADGNRPVKWAPDSRRLLVGRSILGLDGALIAELSVNWNPFVILTANRADRNGDLGIEAVEQVTDGGGNRARGNGDRRQCLGILCR